MKRANRISSFIAVVMLCCSTGVVAEELSEPIAILLGDVSLNKLPFVLALDAGIYTRNGLDIKPMFSEDSVEIIRRSGVEIADEYIFRGKSDVPIKIGGAAPTIVRLTTKTNGWDPVILGSTHRVSRWRIVARPGIEAVEDLKGKRIGYSGVGAVTHFMAISFAEHMGWDPNLDWSMLGDGLGVDALQNNYVDAFVGPELHATMAVDAGYHLLADLGDYELPVAGSSFLFDRQWLAANPEKAQRFIKSTVEAIALLKTDKEATFRTLRKWFQMTDPDLLEFFLQGSREITQQAIPTACRTEKTHANLRQSRDAQVLARTFL